MIIRHARDSDAEQLESFDLGASGSWLDEVAEIVAGLVAWRSDRPSIEFSRNVFPEADETQPPEDDPYVSFALAL